MVTWALLSLQLASGMNFLFLYVNRSPCLCSSGSWIFICFHNFCALFFLLCFIFCKALRSSLGRYINAFVIIMNLYILFKFYKQHTTHNTLHMKYSYYNTHLRKFFSNVQHALPQEVFTHYFIQQTHSLWSFKCWFTVQVYQVTHKIL